MSKSTREFLGAMFFALLMGLMIVTGVFLFQSYFDPYEKNCKQQVEGRVCDIAYDLYWKPTFNI